MRAFKISLAILASLIILAEILLRFYAQPKEKNWDDQPKSNIPARLNDSDTEIKLFVQKNIISTKIIFDDRLSERLSRLFKLSEIAGLLKTSDSTFEVLEEVLDLSTNSCASNSELKPCIIVMNISGQDPISQKIDSSDSNFIRTYSKIKSIYKQIVNQQQLIKLVKTNLINSEYWNKFTEAQLQKTLVVLLPDFRFIAKSYPFIKEHQLFVDLLKKQNIHVLDTYEIFKDIPVLRLVENPGTNYALNEIGTRLLSEKIYEHLKSTQILPPGYFTAIAVPNRIGTEFNDNQKALILK